MEMIKLPAFDHAAKGLTEALSLSDKEAHYVRAAIIFEIIACPIMGREFFNSPEEVPHDMKTMTGLLERANKHMRNVNEQFYMIMIYAQGYNVLNEMLTEAAERSEKGDKRFKEDNLKLMIEKLSDEPGTHVFDVVKLIKDSHYDFSKFVKHIIKDEKYDSSGSYIKPEKDPEQTKEQIEDFLKETLKKAQELKTKAREELLSKKEKKDKSKEDTEDEL